MSDPVSLVSPPVLRPELDKAILQPAELGQFYNLQEQRMILPIHYRDDWTRHTAEEAALSFPVAPVVAYGAPSVSVRVDRPVAADRPVAPATYPALRMPSAPELPSAGERATVPGTEACNRPGTASPAAEPLAYGGDVARVRQLTAEILANGEFVPLVFQYRQAGDLLPVTDTVQTTTVAARRVASVYKAF